MSLSAAIRFFSLLALFAGAAAVVLFTLRLVPARVFPAGHRLLAHLYGVRVWLAWLVATTSTLGSLYFSEVQNLRPCTLCWYQRIAMYPLAVILLVGARRPDGEVRRYALPLAVIGFVIATYHYLVEWNPTWETGSCDLAAPCSVPYFREFDFVSLAFMAMCGFAAIVALLVTPRKEQ
jgi:disulfide bond formation protein DsbB